MQQQITIRLVLFSGLKNGKKLKLPIQWHMVLFYTYAHFMVLWVPISKCNLWTTCKIKQISILWLKIHFKGFFNNSIKIYTSLIPDINDENQLLDYISISWFKEKVWKQNKATTNNSVTELAFWWTFSSARVIAITRLCSVSSLKFHK